MKTALKFAGCAVAVAAMFCLGIIAATQLLLLVDRPMPVWAYPLVVLLVLVAAVAVCAGVMWGCRRANFDRNGVFRMVALVVAVTALVQTSADERPVAADYAVSDFFPTDEGMTNSYPVMAELWRLAGQEGGRFAAFSKALDGGAKGIPDDVTAGAWEDTAALRAQAEKLDDFVQCIDTDPVQPCVRNLDPAANVPRKISRLYCAYSAMLLKQGKPDEAIKPLVRIHSVTRKALPYAIATKEEWLSAARQNIHAAYAIMLNTNCSRRGILMLKQNFSPLSLPEVSEEYLIKCAYISQKTAGRAMLDVDGWQALLRQGENDRMDGFWRWPETGSRAMASFLRFLAHRPNATQRCLRRFTDMELAGAEACPPSYYHVRRSAGDYGRRPPFANVGGWYLIRDSVWFHGRRNPRAFESKIASDLLFMDLCRRLDEECPLTDPYAGRSYECAEGGGEFFSVGPDRIKGSADDIRLSAFVP